jgi:geranylgeranyl pyrophosphate synthase
VREHVAKTCQVMLDSAAFCAAGVSGFRNLVVKVLTDRARRLTALAGGPFPPWLALPILTGEAVAGEAEVNEALFQALYGVAAAWELGNLAATCLDAWQDEDTDEALWREIGPQLAVNLSVGLIALSLRTLTHLAEKDLVGLPAVLELKQGFEDTLLSMAQGQHADLSDDLTLDEYTTVVAAKTGSLFRLACWSGAVVTGASADVAGRYGAFGQALGLLIQAWNDMYGLEGVLGKRDQGHRRTLPILATMALAGRSAGQSPMSPTDALEQGGRLYAVMQAALLYQQAMEALACCPAPGRLARFLDAYEPEMLVAGSAREKV